MSEDQSWKDSRKELNNVYNSKHKNLNFASLEAAI